MKCEVIDIRGNKREKLGKFLIALYALNLRRFYYGKFLIYLMIRINF